MQHHRKKACLQAIPAEKALGQTTSINEEILESTIITFFKRKVVFCPKIRGSFSSSYPAAVKIPKLMYKSVIILTLGRTEGGGGRG